MDSVYINGKKGDADSISEADSALLTLVKRPEDLSIFSLVKTHFL